MKHYIYLVTETAMWSADCEDYGQKVIPIRVFNNEADARYFADHLATDLCRMVNGKKAEAPLLEEHGKDFGLFYRSTQIDYVGLHEWFGTVDSSKYYDVWKVLCDWD